MKCAHKSRLLLALALLCAARMLIDAFEAEGHRIVASGAELQPTTADARWLRFLEPDSPPRSSLRERIMFSHIVAAGCVILSWCFVV